MELKYTQNAISSDGNAIMMLNDLIGYNSKTNTGIRADYFADEMYYHKDRGRDITVYINSPGGQVYAAFNIIQAILDCEANTHIVGMAASMAGVLSQFGVRRTMNDFAVGMIHPPNGGPEALIDITRKQLGDCLKKRSKMSAKRIDAMLENGADDTWLDASEMLSMGLVDEVIVTGAKKNADLKISAKKINEKVLNINETFKIYSDIVNTLSTPPKKHNMEILAQLGAELGIENADQSAVIAKVKDLKTAAAAKADIQNKLDSAVTAKTEAEAAKTAAETAKTVAETALKDERKARAQELIENAILAGKIKEDVKTEYIELATNSYDLAKKTISGIVSGTGSVHNSVHNSLHEEGAAKISPTESDAKKYEDMLKNQPQALNKMYETDRAQYEKLENAFNAFQSKSK